MLCGKTHQLKGELGEGEEVGSVEPLARYQQEHEYEPKLKERVSHMAKVSKGGNPVPRF